jgi:hypothetical protein
VIQRIQTLWLLLAMAATAAVRATAWMDRAQEDPMRWISLLAMGLIAAAVLADGVAVALFSNRQRQLGAIRIANLLQGGLLGVELGVLFTLGGIGFYLWDELIALALTLAAILFQVLASRAIRSDISLVESMDRIR